MRKIILGFSIFGFFFSGFFNPVRAQEAIPSPSDDQLSFDNPAWTANNPSLVTRITSPFYGVKLNCSTGQSVVYELSLPNAYQGDITFDFIEQSQTPGALNYVFIIREMSGSTILHSLDVGVTTVRQDYNGQNFGTNRFFYSTRLDASNKYIASDSFVQRVNGTNTISMVITPAGGYARVNKINLSYLPSNKDAPGATKIFYPVDYSFTKFNRIAIACPWAGQNTTSAGYLLVKNPTVVPIPPEPDRKTVLTTVAKRLLENFPPLPTGLPSEIPEVVKRSSLIQCDPTLVTDPSKYKNWVLSHNGRIHAVKALALAYLYPKTIENYVQIKSELLQSVPYIAGEKGVTASTIAIAYWLAANKYPEHLSELSAIVDRPLKDLAALLASSPIPNDGYIGRSGGDENIYRGNFLAIVGTMYKNVDWDAKGKCLMFHSATRSRSEDSKLLSVPNCNYYTKTVWAGDEAEVNDSAFLEAKNHLVSVPVPFDGRYDNHNYSPHVGYVYGSNLGEIAKFFLAYGGNKSKIFGPTVRHSLDALWNQNLPYIDFSKNLWNSEDIILLKPINRPVPPIASPPPFYDERQYCGSYYNGFTNMFRQYSKSDNFIDPANIISGLVLGSLYKSDFSKTDKLIRYIWYIANDYGVVPYDPPLKPQTLDNTHPGFWQETPHNAIRSLVFPATSIERYVLSAMMLDTSLTLTPIVQIVSSFPADLNKDGKVDIFDYNILISNFGKTGSPGWIPADINKDGKVDIFDYNVLVGSFGK